MWSLESMPVARCPLVGGVKQHRCVMKSAVTTGWECMHISMKETFVDEHPTWLHYRFGPFFRLHLLHTFSVTQKQLIGIDSSLSTSHMQSVSSAHLDKRSMTSYSQISEDVRCGTLVSWFSTVVPSRSLMRSIYIVIFSLLLTWSSYHTFYCHSQSIRLRHCGFIWFLWERHNAFFNMQTCGCAWVCLGVCVCAL